MLHILRQTAFLHLSWYQAISDHDGVGCYANIRTLHNDLLWSTQGARPTIDTSIEFEIQWRFVMLSFITYLADHLEILHTSRQCNLVEPGHYVRIIRRIEHIWNE